MNFISSVPPPFILNCWKHHFQFLKINSAIPFEEIKKGIVQIGESQMDIYVGNLSPAQICSEIEILLSRQIKINLFNYLQWLMSEGKGFRLIEISDGSCWTLRFGEDPLNFIHLHPGRKSPLTIRVKAQVLKIALLAISLNEIEELNTNKINHLRKEYLNLPPVKSIKDDGAVLNLIKLFK